MFEIDPHAVQKPFASRLRWGRDQAVALREQHKLRPFTHEAVLSFITDDGEGVGVDFTRFRDRLSRFAAQRWDVVWYAETARNASQPHFNLILRTERTKEEFAAYLCDCLAHRKGNGTHLRNLFRLHWEQISPERELGLWLYAPKGTLATLRKNTLMAVGTRETWTTGKPFDQPKRKLTSTPERRAEKVGALLALDAELVASVFDGRITSDELWDKKFLWRYHLGYFHRGGRIG